MKPTPPPHAPEPPAPAGGEGAEERFVTELTTHQPALHAFIVSLMPGDSGADEVLQRTNLLLWRKRADFTLGTNFRAWSFECARWTLRAYFKEQQRKNWLVFDDELARAVTDRMAERFPTAPEAPQAALRLCLSRLRDRDRDLLLSHYEEGDSLADCARRTGTTVGTLKVALFRLRAGLRRCITERLAVEAAGS
jgi:RNA polymerase sigma-70 factor (ECF subfamily)